MRHELPEQTIESITHVLLFCEKKAALRDFAGHQPGKRRKLSVCDEIAKRIAPRYMYPVEFKNGDRPVAQEELIQMLADVLRSVPDEEAFLMVSKLEHQKRSTASMIASLMASRAKAAFTMRQRDNQAEMLRVDDPASKPDGEAALDYQRRLGTLHPRYRWNRTINIHMPDFTGYDLGVPFARVWRDYSKGSAESWQWECTTQRDRRLNSRPTGGADITRQAARDAEDYYDALKRLNDIDQAMEDGK